MIWWVVYFIKAQFSRGKIYASKKVITPVPKVWGWIVAKKNARNLLTPRSVVLSLICGKCFGHSAPEHSHIQEPVRVGNPKCECRTCCTQPFTYAAYAMVHNIAFSYSTVTQDITYHNAKINATDGAWRWLTRGCE